MLKAHQFPFRSQEKLRISNMIRATRDVHAHSLGHSGVGGDTGSEVDAADSQPERVARQFLQRRHGRVAVRDGLIETPDFLYLTRWQLVTGR